MAKKSRVFLRGMSSEQYGLKEFREAQLAAPRVRTDDVVADDAQVGHSGDSKDSRTWWRIGPGDEPFLTQNLQVHFVEIPAGKSNHGHGHQNEAVFYILRGKGYEIHDDVKYPWEAGDLAVVHVDSVHRHFNDGDETAKAFVVKAKSTWMYHNLIQQGRSGPIDGEDAFGPREDWSRLWTPGLAEKVKIVKPADTVWETTRDGKVRVLCSKDTPNVRVVSVDIYEQEIPPGSRSAKHLHMPDEVAYVLSGRDELALVGRGFAPPALRLQLRPGVFQAERSVEDEPSRGRVGIRAEVAKALELHRLTNRQLRERRLDQALGEHRLRVGVDVGEQ